MGLAAPFLHILFLFSILLQSKLIPLAAQDFRYMTLVKNATDMPLLAQYDYIVIGGGTAGCPLAATLSANYSVLVLERGSVPLEHPEVFSASNYLTVLSQDDDGTTPAQKFTSEDGVENWRGRILGGTSMINGGYYSRADPGFYQVSGINWEMDVVEESYEWVEETVAYESDLSPWSSLAKEALLQANVTPDNNYTLEHLIGTKASASLFKDSLKRFGAVELLNKADFTNLRIAVRASVDRIIFFRSSSNLIAKGVTYKDSKGRSHKAMIRGQGEVILSAGHLGSPQLLLLSGIGPVSYLSKLHIPLIYPHPFVGKLVYDIAFNYVIFSSPIPLNESILQVVGILKNFSYIETASFNNAGAFASKVARILSVGNYSLQSSTDVKVPPKIRYNYFSAPLDLGRCVNGVKRMVETLYTPILDQFKFVNNATGEREFRFVGPAPPLNGSDAEVGAFCKSAINSTSHYHGGCLVGKVVDENLRVKGIGALRVVDASVLTEAPGTNPQATIMMLGRYMGLQILKHRIGA